jgi:hypothetical protein
MATIRQVYKNIHAVKFPKIVRETIIQHKTNMEDLNREQMVRGYDRDDERIGAYASEQYENEKRRMNPAASGWVDLKYTGSFHNLLTMKLLKDNIFTFYSKDKKNKDLVETWGANIFGLSTKSREDLIDEYGFKKSLVTNYKKAAKLI